MSDFEIHIESADLFLNEHNWPAAKAALAKAMELGLPPDHIQCLRISARLALADNQEAEAQKIYNTISLDTKDLNFMADAALFFATHQNIEKAAPLAEHCVQFNSDYPNGHLANFYVKSAQNQYKNALESLKRAIRRGADYSSHKAFELIHTWTQTLCNEEQYQQAFEIITEIADFFATADFYIMGGRVAELCAQRAAAVSMYKKTLLFLRQGSLRTEILERIAVLAE